MNRALIIGMAAASILSACTTTTSSTTPGTTAPVATDSGWPERTVAEMGSAAAAAEIRARGPWEPPSDRHCESGGILLDGHFSAGQLGDCTPGEDGAFTLTLYPENAPPINPSPWFAVRVSGSEGDTLSLTIDVDRFKARYWPKYSVDGEHWAPLPDTQARFVDDGAVMQIDMTLTQSVAWIAGGELLTDSWYQAWLRDLGDSGEVDVSLLGESAQGRPLWLAATAPKPEMVMFIGRQHPPEVTGALTMHPFVETVFADTDLARAFRDRFQVVMVPLVNPDGVALGHWRHNTGGVDLNRDWGPFTQPETRAVRDWLAANISDDHRIRLLLDFHSTKRNLFYTHLDTDVTDPPNVARDWLAAGAARLPDYAFTREASAPGEQANSKNWFFSTYGIPSVTYETGDETDREAIRHSATVFAEEMMKVMLATPAP
ncbi:peptidase M14 [Marinihelvus fidelis]|uniref:Peptidase M14 n=1 Tax=Marinihelvus fidelis TaxID=2613842 RepID=A0A5N0T517_9GAMM|nr:M14 family zinc carboxypeptidase [Marinihelvus fidelis]KAA9130180.1 peptidase M14 [Marinihelvus fidelis]